jgi:hypothetical protein
VKYVLELRSRRRYLKKKHGLDVFWGRLRRVDLQAGVRALQNDDAPGDGGPDEAAVFIAETVAALAKLARRHKLGVLVRLLEMTQMEAEERVRLRGKRKLS